VLITDVVNNRTAIQALIVNGVWESLTMEAKQWLKNNADKLISSAKASFSTTNQAGLPGIIESYAALDELTREESAPPIETSTAPVASETSTSGPADTAVEATSPSTIEETVSAPGLVEKVKAAATSVPSVFGRANFVWTVLIILAILGGVRGLRVGVLDTFEPYQVQLKAPRIPVQEQISIGDVNIPWFTDVSFPKAPFAYNEVLMSNDADATVQMQVMVENSMIKKDFRNDIVLFLTVVVLLVLAIKDNGQERGGQAPAIRCSWGVLVFYVGLLFGGWWRVLFAFTGLTMAIRLRKGETQRLWPFLVRAALIVYVVNDTIMPLLPRILGAIEKYIPGLPDVIRQLLQDPRIGTLGYFGWLGYYLFSMWKKGYDQTNSTVLGLSQLVWFKAFGVFPYWEHMPSAAQPWFFWITLCMCGLGTLIELAETKTLIIAFLSTIGSGIMFLTSWGLQTVGIMGFVSSPMILDYAISFLMTFGYSVMSNMKGDYSKILGLWETWQGVVVDIGPFKVPIDTILIKAILWIVMMFLGIKVLW
jgi:hypothetical protein